MNNAIADDTRVVLVETSDALPGLLPFQAWDALATADVIWVRDREAHPSARHLYAAGLDLEELAPATLERGDLDLSLPGGAEDRRYAKALVQRAIAGEVPVFLLGPDDTGIAPALAGMAAERDLQIELVFFAPQPEGAEVLRLVELMRHLRDPEHGCPWDLEQDHASLIPHLLEEAYELVEAVETGEDEDIVEELGDVLLQIVFHSQIARDRGSFGVDDVAKGIADKLERRHPHVFGDVEATTAAQVQANWDQLKAQEKSRTGPFEGVPELMAALMLLETLQRKAAKQGVDAPVPASSAMRAEVERRLQDAQDRPDAAQQVIGDLLAGVVAVARELRVDPELAGRAAARRFRDQVERVHQIATERGLELGSLDRSTMTKLWEAAQPPR